MPLLFFLFLLTPLFSVSLEEAVSETLEFSTVPVWYIQAKDKGVLILAGTEKFYFADTSPRRLFSQFPHKAFLWGHIYNTINRKIYTNYVFIRRDQISLYWFEWEKVIVKLKKKETLEKPERIRMSKIVNPQKFYYTK